MIYGAIVSSLKLAGRTDLLRRDFQAQERTRRHCRSFHCENHGIAYTSFKRTCSKIRHIGKGRTILRIIRFNIHPKRRKQFSKRWGAYIFITCQMRICSRIIRICSMAAGSGESDRENAVPFYYNTLWIWWREIAAGQTVCSTCRRVRNIISSPEEENILHSLIIHQRSAKYVTVLALLGKSENSDILRAFWGVLRWLKEGKLIMGDMSDHFIIFNILIER